MIRGSNFEIHRQLVIAAKLGYGSKDSPPLAESLSAEVGKMLVTMMKRL
jgi:hypothetical protein